MTTPLKPIELKQAVWCLHCERTYQQGEDRRLRGLSMCPYPDCDGDTVIDQWRWSRIRRENPNYPQVPERGVVYLLHGPEWRHPTQTRT